MKKESFLTSTTKLIVTVSLIVGVGAIFGMLVYSETIPKSEVVVNDVVEKIENQEQEIINAQQVILSDEEVYEILKEFANEGLTLFPERMEKYNKVLIDALEFKGETTKEKLTKIEKNLEEEGKVIQDAPDMRSFYSAYIKVCLAKSIIYDDLKNTCGIKEDSSLSIDGVDDLTALEQILPYFVIGLAYYSEGDYVKANHYFNQIELHRQALKTYNYELDLPYLKLYKRAYNKAISLIQDEISDWQTYRNEEYGFEFEYPGEWGDYNKLEELEKFEKDRGKTYNFDNSDFKLSFEKKDFRIENQLYAFTLDHLPAHFKEVIDVNYCSIIKKENNFIGSNLSCEIVMLSNQKGVLRDDLACTGSPTGGEISCGFYRILLLENEDPKYPLFIISTFLDNYNYYESCNYFSSEKSECFDKAKEEYKKVLEKHKNKIDDFNQILSTFKFIEKDETADWQTYQNEEYGFEFKYPKSAKIRSQIYGVTDSEKASHITISDSEDLYVRIQLRDPLFFKGLQKENLETMSLLLENYAKNVWQLNKDDIERFPEKKVGEIVKTEVGNKMAYQFMLTHSFMSETGGYLFEDEKVIVFTSSNEIKYLIEINNNVKSKEVLKTFKFIER